jgi:hypothetical protein
VSLWLLVFLLALVGLVLLLSQPPPGARLGRGDRVALMVLAALTVLVVLWGPW